MIWFSVLKNSFLLIPSKLVLWQDRKIFYRRFDKVLLFASQEQEIESKIFKGHSQILEWRRLCHNSLFCGERMKGTKGQMQLYYDEEGDFLEINVGEYTEGYFRDVGEGISERVDEKTGKVTGISILSFKRRSKKDMKIDLPVNIEISGLTKKDA